jgi:hypothetical protein
LNQLRKQKPEAIGLSGAFQTFETDNDAPVDRTVNSFAARPWNVSPVLV